MNALLPLCAKRAVLCVMLILGGSNFLIFPVLADSARTFPEDMEEACPPPVTYPAPPNILANVPEAADYELVYLKSPITHFNDDPSTYYDVNNTAGLSSFSYNRIAYYLELEHPTYGAQWVWVSMDDFTGGNINQTGLPVLGVVFDQLVNNMNVFSNVPAVVTGMGITTGNVEIWREDYSQPSDGPVFGGAPTAWDYDDTRSTSGVAGFGSFQIHNYGTPQTIMAINRFGNIEMGIGNAPGAHTDWTYASNGNEYTVKNFYVLVSDVYPPGVFCQDVSVQLNASGNAGITVADVLSSTVGDAAVDTYSLDVSNFTCADVGPNTVELTADFVNGVSVSCTATVTVGYHPDCALTVTFPAPPTVLANVPEAVDYELVYCKSPITHFNDDPDTYYDINNTVPLAPYPFNRVAYYLELDHPTYGSQWVWVSMDDFTGGMIHQTGLPVLGVVYDQFVANMNVFSNVPSVVTGTGITTGNVEIWREDYSQPSDGPVFGGAPTAWDYDDTRSTAGVAGFGSFQIHNYGTPQTIMAINRFGNIEMGIGNAPGAHTDWTYASNGNEYTVKNFYVLVTIDDPPGVLCQDITVQLDASGQASIAAADIFNGTTGNGTIDTYSLDVSSFTCADVGPSTVELTATFVGGATAKCAATVTVEDDFAPLPACQDITVQLNAAGSASITGADIYVGPSGPCGLPPLSVTPSSFTCADIGDNIVVLTVDDDSGGSNCWATVTVEDIEPPTIICPGDITQDADAGQCTAFVSVPPPTVSDNCPLAAGGDGTPGNPFTSLGAALTVTTAGIYFFDVNGNQFSTFLDGNGWILIASSPAAPGPGPLTITPSLTPQSNAILPAAIYADGTIDQVRINATSGPNLPLNVISSDAGVLNNLMQDRTLSFGLQGPPNEWIGDINDRMPFTCTSLTGTLAERVFHACGNQEGLHWLPVDNFFQVDIGAGTNDLNLWVRASAAGPSTPVAINDYNGTGDASDTYPVGTTTVTWTVTDGSGNSSSCTMDVTVEDNEAPTANCQDVTVQLDVGGQATITAAEINNGSSDNCTSTSDLLLNISNGQTNYTCSDVGNVFTVTLQVEDEATNTHTCVSQVTVEDVNNPCAPAETLDFDGNDDFVDFGNIHNFGTSDFTIEFWFNASNIIAPDIQGGTYLLAKGLTTFGTPPQAGYGFRLSLENGQNELRFAVGSPYNYVIYNGVSTNTWYHVAGVREGNTISLYVNGTLAQSLSTGSVIDVNTNLSLGLGAINRGPSLANTTSFDGQIDEVRIWNRGLCADELNTYTTCVLSGNENGLLSWYDFNQGLAGGNNITETTLIDRTSNGNDGNLNNFTLNGNASNWLAPGVTQSGSCSPYTDTTDPVITCPATVTVNNDPGLCAANVTYPDATASDNCGDVTITYSQNSGTDFPVGTTSVTATAIDGSGNTGSCSFNVIVIDNEPPTAVCQDVTVQLDANGNASIPTNTVNLTTIFSEDFSSDPDGNTTILTNWNVLSGNVDVNDYIPGAASPGREIDLAGLQNAKIETINAFTLIPGTYQLSFVHLDNTYDSAEMEVTIGLVYSNTFQGSPSSPTSVTETFIVTSTTTATIVLEELGPSDNAGTFVGGIVLARQENIGLAVDGGSTDACGIASTSVNPSDFTCADVGTNSVTLTVTDNNGNTSTCTATVTVEDNIAPAAICQDATIELDASGNASLTTADVDGGSSDNCGTPTLGVAPSSFTCANVGPNSVTLTASDGGGNSSCTATVTVEDNVAPTAVCQDATVQLDANGNASITVADVDGGSSDNCVTPTLNVAPSSFTCSDIGTNTVTLTASDGVANSSCTAIVTVEDNVAPTAVCQDVTVQLDVAGNASITTADINNSSSDNCTSTGNLVLSVINGQTNYSCSDVGNVFSVTLQVEDEANYTHTCVSQVTVEDANNHCVPAETLDFDGDDDFVDFGNIHNFGTSDFTIEFWFNASSIIPSNSLGGTYLLAKGLTSVGSPPNAGYGFRLNLENGQNELRFTIGTPSNFVIYNGIAPNAWYHVAGVREGNTISLYVNGTLAQSVSTGGVINVNTSLSLGLGVVNRGPSNSNTTSFDGQIDEVRIWGRGLCADELNTYTTCVLSGNENGLLSWYDFNQGLAGGNNSTEILLIDRTSNGNDGSLNNFTLNGNASNWLAPGVTNSGSCSPYTDTTDPVITCPATVTVNNDPGLCATNVTYPDATASDNCGEVTITYSQNSGANFPVGTTSVTATATDESSNASSCSFDVIVIDNEAPIAVCPASLPDVVLDASGNGTLPANIGDLSSTDNCPGVVESSPGMTFTCTDIGPQSVTLTATDAVGLTHTTTCNFNVINSPPTAVCQDATVQLDANGNGTITVADVDGGAGDACGPPMLDVTPSTFNCADIGTITVTLTAIGSGGVSSCTATVTVEDNIPPVAVCQDITVQLDGSGNVTITAADVDGGSSDNCGPPVLSVTPSSFTCADIGINTVTLTASDSGGSSSCTATVTVEDDIRPTIICPGDETISTDPGICTATYTVPQPMIDDNCEVTVLRYRYRLVNNNCANIPAFGWSPWTTNPTLNLSQGKWKIQWQAKDASGNQRRCSFCVTVVDGQPPSLSCPAPITVDNDPGDCGAVVGFSATVTDNCPGVVVDYGTPFGDFYPVGTTTVTVTATDGAGNESQCTLDVTVNDTERPTRNCSGLTITVPTDPGECTADVALPIPIFADNCGIEVIEFRYREVNSSNVPLGPWTAWTDVSSASDIFPVGRYRIRWRAIDAAGNRRGCTRFLTIEDVEPPTVNCFDQTIIFNGEESFALPVEELAEASDNCGVSSLTLDFNAVFCDQVGQQVPITATAVDENGLVSTCTSIVSVEGLPCHWSQQPDGVGCADGSSVSYDVPSETFTLISIDCYNPDSTDIDEYAFAQYNLCGDGIITAEITNILGTSSGWAGVMMRESNNPQARSVALTTDLASNHRREVRTTPGGPLVLQPSPAYSRYWLRLRRVANFFVGYASPDGQIWQLIFWQTITMDQCIEVGLVVNGSTLSGITTATFANVSVQGSTFYEFQANAPVVEETVATKTFSVFPNPTAGQVTITLGDFLEQEIRLEVLDVNGKRVQLVREGILENSTEKLDLGQLPAGLYFLRLQLADGTVQTQRVVLQPRP